MLPEFLGASSIVLNQCNAKGYSDTKGFKGSVNIDGGGGTEDISERIQMFL